MKGRNWKVVQPRDRQDAMDLCLKFAKERHNRSVDSVAVAMGDLNKWTLYKYIEEGSLPLRLVRPFEMACGIDFVSRWLVMSGGNKMVVDIPVGRECSAEDMNDFQAVLHTMVGELIRLYGGKGDVASATAAIQTALESVAWHKANVQKFVQPELPFDEE